MLNPLLSSGSAFDTSKTVLWQWLNKNADVVKTLALKDLSIYGNNRFICGWMIDITTSNQTFEFHIILDTYFPYSPIRIAYKTNDFFLKWPHVEPNGLLCLPVENSDGIEEKIYKNLFNAIELIENCQNSEQFREKEFQDEFISYWNHSTGSVKINSLLDINNTTSRLIYIWNDSKFKLVGESIEQIESWLKHEGFHFNLSMVTTGIFGFLHKPPIPPFPQKPINFIKALAKNSNNITELLAKIPFHESAVIVLGAKTTNSGTGLIAVELSAQSINGFRRKKLYSDRINLLLRKKRGFLNKKDIQRLDAQWIHGRDQNEGLKALQNAKVLVLGCGSLGSQVAMRLAQSGVGNIILIDHDILVPANVGRHALGINSVGKFKSTELKREIQKKYPHIQTVESYNKTWQQVYTEKSDVINNNSLIISCMGEWTAEGQLSDWQDSLMTPHPIIYGWLDENGTASHAVAIVNQSISLKCIINENGILRNPETIWEKGGLMQTEPACGTSFQPYGPLDVVHAEALVTRVAIEFLTNKISSPTHHVYAGSTSKIKDAKGEWSAEHLKYRPIGFEGAFEYEKSLLSKCQICEQCKKI